MPESLEARGSTGVARPHIIVGVDGSPASIGALRQAAALGETLGGSIEAVCTWEFPASVLGAIPEGWSPEADAHTIVGDAANAVYGGLLPSNLTLTTLEGSAARRLIELGADADLLIVGSRGHGGFAGLLLGSVSSTVAEHAQCPVLVMHGQRTLARSAA